MYEIFEKLLKNRGLRVSDVSKATGLSSTFFTEWKKGKSKTPKTENLMKIADYFNVSLDYLMTGEEPKLSSYPEQAELLVKIRNDKKLFNAIEKYYALSDRQKEHVLELIDLLGEV